MADKRCVLLFSGGRDSSLACIKLASKGYDLHLITFDNGATRFSKYANYRYNELRKLCPDRIKCRLLMPSYGLFREIAVVNIEADFKKYKKNLICLGCKLAMHVMSLTYCVKNDIHTIADGYTAYQKSKFVEQRPEVIAEVRKLHAEFGVEYLNPVYDAETESSIKKQLLVSDVSPKSLEASCLFADTFSVPQPEEFMPYLKEKLALSRVFLADFIQNDKFIPIYDITNKTVKRGLNNGNP